MNIQLINDLQDYMFTAEALNRFTKHMIHINGIPKASTRNIIKDDHEYDDEYETKVEAKVEAKVETKDVKLAKPVKTQTIPKPPMLEKKNTEQLRKIETFYKPKQKDSLFWCLYILKHGYFNYEMEISGQYFIVEKQEKFKYIDMLRKNKELLKIHKIKPFTELEDNLANSDRISVKTFFALCILENINVLLVDKRKIYELICVDIDDKHPVYVVHRNNKTMEHQIELNTTDEMLHHYRETYYKCETLDASIKGIGSYKLDELIDLCKKLDININTTVDPKKKMTKKTIYELLVQNY